MARKKVDPQDKIILVKAWIKKKHERVVIKKIAALEKLYR